MHSRLVVLIKLLIKNDKLELQCAPLKQNLAESARTKTIKAGDAKYFADAELLGFYKANNSVCHLSLFTCWIEAKWRKLTVHDFCPDLTK